MRMHYTTESVAALHRIVYCIHSERLVLSVLVRVRKPCRLKVRRPTISVKTIDPSSSWLYDMYKAGPQSNVRTSELRDLYVQ